MRSNFPKNCKECDRSTTCNNPGPYGSFRCVYRPYIEEALIRETLNPKKEEVKNNGNR